MKYHFKVLGVALLLLCSCGSKEEKTVTEKPLPIDNEIIEAPTGFTQLFNGKDFAGWNILTMKENAIPDQFTVEKGIIHVYSSHEPNTEQSFACLITDEEYENYILTLEYKWGQKKFKPRASDVRDAGVLFHVYREDIFWPFGAECQIQEGDTGDVWLIGTKGSSTVRKSNRNYGSEGEIYTRGGENEYDSFARSSYWGIPGWNQLELEVKGGHAKFKVNGKLVNEVFDLKQFDNTSKEWVPLTKGKIGIQAEGAEIYYRNIFIKPIG